MEAGGFETLASRFTDRPLMAAVHHIKATYASAGNGPAMAEVIALVMSQGELLSS